MTTSRRDWQLEQMGIRQYQLRRPAALLGEVAMVLPANLKVILLAETLPALSSPLMQDILRAMLLSVEQVYCLTPEQAMMVPEDTRCVFWLMGVAQCPDLPAALTELPVLSTPTLPELADNPEAKRTLWQQICRDEYHFLPQAG